MKFFFATLLLVLICCLEAKAQYSSQKDAVYMATIKAVADYKINDEENLKNVEDLRQNKRFLQELKSYNWQDILIW